VTFRAIAIIIVVVGAVVGGLLFLRSSASTGMPSADVLERAKKRAREQQASEDDGRGR
jgi:hypothetical protein